MHVAQMHWVHGLISLLGLFNISGTAASSLPNATLTTADGSDAGLDNFTVSIPMPKEFAVTFEIGGPKLRQTACLMNVIDALKQLALATGDARIIDGTEYRSTSYPEVSILVNTRVDGGTMQARYVMWAIVLGVRAMISQKKFELAQFQLTFNKRLVGWVHIVNSPSVLILAGNGDPSINNTLTNGTESDGVNITTILTTDNTNDPVEDRLTTAFEPTGGQLTPYDIFQPIMNSLSDMAEFPTNSRSNGIVSGFRGTRGVICILEVMPERTNPPFLEYGWLIRAMARIPTYMIQQGRFGEIELSLAVDGVEIGYGKVGNIDDVCTGPRAVRI